MINNQEFSFNFSKLETYILPEEVDYINLRNNVMIQSKDIIIKYTKNPLFNFLVLFDNKEKKLYIYGNTDLSTLLKPQEHIEYTFDEETFEFKPMLKGINTKILQISTTDDKSYCIELLFYPKYTLKINFITTNDKIGCKIDDQGCKSLNFIFRELYLFLHSIDFKGVLILDDDSQVDNESLLTYNLINGKESIYCKYGFKYQQEEWIEKIQPFLYLIEDFKDDLTFKNISDEKYKTFLSKLKSNLEYDFKNLKLVKMINPDYRFFLADKCNFKGKCNENELLSLYLTQDLEEKNLDTYITNIQKIKDMNYILIQSYEDIIFPEDIIILNQIKEDQDSLKEIIKLTSKILKYNGFNLKHSPLRLEKISDLKVDIPFIKSLSKFLFIIDLKPLAHLISKNLLN
jgi:hypothetical protein